MRPAWLLSFVLFSLVAACGSEAPAQTETRGRVIDQTTGKGIPGALVMATYITNSGPHLATTCKRIEQAIADADGWFVMPLDDRTGTRVMFAYKREYSEGSGNKRASGEEDRWYVDSYDYDENGKLARISGTNGERYKSKREALNASREWIDIYLKPAHLESDSRQQQLAHLAIVATCPGKTRSTTPPLEYLDAIFREQLEIGAPKVDLDQTLAIKSFQGRQ